MLEPRLSWGASAAGRVYGLGDLDFLRVVRVAMLSGDILEGSTAFIQEIIREVNPSLFDSKTCGSLQLVLAMVCVDTERWVVCEAGMLWFIWSIEAM